MRSHRIALAAVFVTFAGAGHAAPPTRAGVLSGSPMEAEVRAQRRKPWRTYVHASPIPVGTEVRCGRGCTLELGVGYRARLGEGAVVGVAEPTFVRVGGPDEPAERTEHLLVFAGSVEVERPASMRGHVLVENAQTGHLVAVGVGTTRVLAASDRTLVGLRDGSARVRAADRTWSALAPRTAVTLRAGASASPPRPLVVAPTWAAATREAPAGPIGLADPDASVPLGAMWSPVAGAAGYRFVVARDRDLVDHIATIRTDAQATGAATEPLPVGRYFARVVASDAEGLESEPSSVLPMRVVGVALSAGARLDGRTLVLPEGRRARLLDPAGLDVAVDRGGFVRAVAELGGGARSFRVRLEGERASETSFGVEPPSARADVRIAPALPRWPNDPLDLVVDVSDPKGRASLAELAPKITVLLGIDEVRAEWREDAREVEAGHRVYRARLAPRKTSGPTVVRVLVSDGDGAPLGRGFVEVDAE